MPTRQPKKLTFRIPIIPMIMKFTPSESARFLARVGLRPQRGLALAMTLLLMMVHVAAGSNPPPNIVLILADDMGYGDLGCYPKDRSNVDAPAITPHIDSLAAQGVKFMNACSLPMCSPARAALLTGRYPARFGFYGNADSHSGLPRTEVMLQELLRSRGYATACIGKWHVGHLDGYRPLDRGFERFYGFLGASHDYFKPAWGTDTDGEMYDGSWVWDQDRKVEKFSYLTDQFTDEALRFIDQSQQKKQPFFLYLPYSAPHGPEQAPAEAIEEFSRYPHVKNRPRTVVRAMIDALDQNIGRLQRELFLRGLDSNTIIVFASDNGGNEYEEPAGLRSVEHNGGLRGRKFTLWEGGVRVPMIIRWPDTIAKGLTYEKPVLLLDLYATLASAAGATVPADRTMDCVDLLPFLTTQSDRSPHDFILSFMDENDWWSIREGDWKLVNESDSLFTRNAARPPREMGLFNLATDPMERNNLIAKHPERAEKLRGIHAERTRDFIPSLSSREAKKKSPTKK
jgi:arylsulfatase A-like enzyme